MPDTTKQNSTSWSLIIGFCLFAISVIIPLAGIPLVAMLRLSTAVSASISGALLIGSEVLGLISVAVMGKEGYEFVKNRLLTHLKALTPDRPIGRQRYNWGLVLFSVPLIFGWFSVYVADLIPYFSDHAIYHAIIFIFRLFLAIVLFFFFLLYECLFIIPCWNS